MTPQTAAALRALEQIAMEMRDSGQREAGVEIVVGCVHAWQRRLTAAHAYLAAVLTQEGAETGDPERYLMDHGMIHDRKTGQHISTDEQTHPGGTNELFGRLRSYERMVHDYPKLSEFFSKHALGSMLAPSCFGCGDELQTWDGTTRHLELMDVFLCAKCATACKSAPAEPRAAEGAGTDNFTWHNPAPFKSAAITGGESKTMMAGCDSTSATECSCPLFNCPVHTYRAPNTTAAALRALVEHCNANSGPKDASYWARGYARAHMLIAEKLAAVLTQEGAGIKSSVPEIPDNSTIAQSLTFSLEAPTGQPARAWTEQEKADCLAAVRECVNEEKATIDRIADYLADARSCEFDPSWSQFLRWLSDFIYKQPAAPAEPRAAEGAGTVAYLVKFDDTERDDVFFAGEGAERAALEYFDQSQVNWSCYLFRCIAGPKPRENSTVFKPTAAAAVPAGGDAEGYPIGYVLATRVLQSDLYEQLDDVARADCDELIAEGGGAPDATLTPPAAQAQDAGPMARHIKQAVAEFADIHMSEQVCDEVLKLARALAAKDRE